MRVILNLLLALFFACCSILGAAIFTDIEKLDQWVAMENSSSEQQPPGGGLPIMTSHPLRFISWDADANNNLAKIITNHANASQKTWRKDQGLSKALEYYNTTLQFRPNDFTALVDRLEILIDLGAPPGYILPEIDTAITLTPKDQFSKAEIALVCFKMLASSPDDADRAEIINRIRALFLYSMDYRGLTEIRRYAKFYDQMEVLDQVLKGLERDE